MRSALKKIVYIGNKLSGHGFSPTSIETLGPLLEGRFHVVYASDRQHKWRRLWDMVATVLRHRRDAHRILIDTYSTSAFYYAWIVSQVARACALPYVPILHGGSLPARISRNGRLSRMMFGHAANNVAPSRYLGLAFDRHGYRTSVIPNFIPIRQYEFTARSVFRPRILWVRSFDRSYNPQLAIHVLSRLLATHSDASLCMVGPDKDGSLVECKSLAVRLGVESRVSFPGRLSKIEWHRLSVEYDIFLNTTNVDNTPVSVMEAMALGLPVVSTNVDGIPYLLDHDVTGLLVDPDDSRAAAEAIDRLIASPDLGMRLATNGRRHVEQFDADEVLDKWQTLLES